MTEQTLKDLNIIASLCRENLYSFPLPKDIQKFLQNTAKKADELKIKHTIKKATGGANGNY